MLGQLSAVEAAGGRGSICFLSAGRETGDGAGLGRGLSFL